MLEGCVKYLNRNIKQTIPTLIKEGVTAFSDDEKANNNNALELVLNASHPSFKTQSASTSECPDEIYALNQTSDLLASLDVSILSQMII